MAIVETAQAKAPSRAAELDRFRLRGFVDSLAKGDELETVREAVDLADVAGVLEGNPKAVLFRAVGPERQELVGNVTGSRSRLARAFGVAPNELLAEVLRRLRSKPEIVDLPRAQAPVQ
jgi:UbiD family decarboxylase